MAPPALWLALAASAATVPLTAARIDLVVSGVEYGVASGRAVAAVLATAVVTAGYDATADTWHELELPPGAPVSYGSTMPMRWDDVADAAYAFGTTDAVKCWLAKLDPVAMLWGLVGTSADGPLDGFDAATPNGCLSVRFQTPR